MIHNPLNGKLSISHRQSHNNRTHRLHIIMHNTSIRYRILRKLIIKKLDHFQFLNIFFYIFGSFFLRQWLPLLYQGGKVDICTFIKNFQGEA